VEQSNDTACFCYYYDHYDHYDYYDYYDYYS
jgi:hypothetical protein